MFYCFVAIKSFNVQLNALNLLVLLLPDVHREVLKVTHANDYWYGPGHSPGYGPEHSPGYGPEHGTRYGARTTMFMLHFIF